jgi:hypothetical protein
MLHKVRRMINLTNCIWFAFVTFAKLSIAKKTEHNQPFRHQVSVSGRIARSHSITDEASKSHESRGVRLVDFARLERSYPDPCTT